MLSMPAARMANSVTIETAKPETATTTGDP
jgi:hypothetical protein